MDDTTPKKELNTISPRIKKKQAKLFFMFAQPKNGSDTDVIFIISYQRISSSKWDTHYKVNNNKQNKGVSNIKSSLIWRAPRHQISSTNKTT